jgi:hypothetical protein
MKNFSELLATDLKLDIVVNGKTLSAGLHEVLVFDADDTVIIDNIEILPKYQYLVDNGKLTISEPFYRWYHRLSGQGWLLTPH